MDYKAYSEALEREVTELKEKIKQMESNEERRYKEIQKLTNLINKQLSELEEEMGVK